jgi:hypothetical protein
LIYIAGSSAGGGAFFPPNPDVIDADPKLLAAGVVAPKLLAAGVVAPNPLELPNPLAAGADPKLLVEPNPLLCCPPNPLAAGADPKLLVEPNPLLCCPPNPPPIADG